MNNVDFYVNEWAILMILIIMPVAVALLVEIITMEESHGGVDR